MAVPTIVVFTATDPETIINEGGSRAWALDPRRAKECEYLVCTRNQNGSSENPDETHGAAFLIGKIRNIVPSQEEKERFVIELSQHALVSLPGVWRKGDRNPVRYTTLDDLNIDPANFHFEDTPHPDLSPRRKEWHMEGVGGWFRRFPKSDREISFEPAALTVNDDATITVTAREGKHDWDVHLRRDPRWEALNGEATCAESTATVTSAFLVESGPRKWMLLGEWIEYGESWYWFADFLETQPSGERLKTLLRKICEPGKS